VISRRMSAGTILVLVVSMFDAFGQDWSRCADGPPPFPLSRESLLNDRQLGALLVGKTMEFVRPALTRASAFTHYTMVFRDDRSLAVKIKTGGSRQGPWTDVLYYVTGEGKRVDARRLVGVWSIQSNRLCIQNILGEMERCSEIYGANGRYYAKRVSGPPICKEGEITVR